MSGSDWNYGPRPNLPSYPPSRQITIRDINPDFTLDGKKLQLEDDDVYKAQIRHILSTPIGSEHEEPTFGSNLPFRLFDPITDLTAFLMETDTIVAVSTWMKGKITLIRPTITPLGTVDGYTVVLPYQKVQAQQPTVFGFEMRRPS